MKKNELLYLANSNPFDSTAISNRIISELIGFKSNGINIKLISLSLKESNEDRIISDNGSVLCKFYAKKTSNRYINYFLKRFVLLIFLGDIIFKNELTIYQYGLSPRLIWTLSLLRKIKPIVLIREIAEYPRFISEGIEPNYINRLYLRELTQSCDLMVVISHALVGFVKELSDTKTIVVNMLVDLNRFSLNFDKENVISYCGSMSNSKDGIENLIKAFILFNKKCKEKYKLRLIGDISNKKKFNALQEIFLNSEEQENIEFTGIVGKDDIPELLGSSKIVALCRPSNKQAEGGFPTKLGEYLASGSPVLVTDVGEIGLFIKDGINGFLSKSDDPRVFAEKLLMVANDYNFARKIGIEGKKMANIEFNPATQIAKVCEYLTELPNRNFN